MKQNISIADLYELPWKLRDEIRDWWLERASKGDTIVYEGRRELTEYKDEYFLFLKPKMFMGFNSYPNTNNIYPLLNIGQCIEYLKEKTGLQLIDWGDEEPIDLLWRGVKEVVKK
jgi:hypothetical protein